jgi:hypothetical protein
MYFQNRSSPLKTPIIINGWLIEATLKLLRCEAADLCNYITATTSRPPIKTVFRDNRNTLLSSYELVMSYAEAFAIYSMIELSRQKFGSNRMFEGMHLHTMAELWRDYVEKLAADSADNLFQRPAASNATVNRL